MNTRGFDNCFLKTKKFRPKTLGGKREIEIRQLNIDEVLKSREIARDEDKTQKDFIFYSVKCAMVNPTFFTDEELKNINSTGLNLIEEIYQELPTIGMSEKERANYFKRIKEIAEEIVSKEKISEEEIKKK